MKRIELIILIIILLAACSSENQTPAVLPVTSDQQVSPLPLNPRPDIYQVKAWVNDPAPPTNARIVLRGSLTRYGHFLGATMMSAIWPDETHTGGGPNCISQVTYGSGKCVIDVSSFPPGIYVPISVIFKYGGMVFTAETGFTPQEP